LVVGVIIRTILPFLGKFTVIAVLRLTMVVALNTTRILKLLTIPVAEANAQIKSETLLIAWAYKSA